MAVAPTTHIFKSNSLAGNPLHSTSLYHRRHRFPSFCIAVAIIGDITMKKKDTTTNKKRPRKVKELNPKPPQKQEFEIGDIEDFIFTKRETLEIREALLKWYDINQRDLPWRRISNYNNNDDVVGGDGDMESERRAYAVWVSEVMLQQTRVQTVIDYFNRWMAKWPTLHHLALASLEEVNEMWAGLGYYRRGRFLLEGAKMIVEEGLGFPKTVAALRKVRGIGEYTAGAIASIAFKEAVPVVDGNVVRVIARLKAISANPKESATVKSFWKLAGQIVDPCRPGDFNQALMELGATICTPTSPSCSSCPISTQCHALSGSQCSTTIFVTDYPTKVVKAKQRHDFSAVSVVEIVERQNIIDKPQSGSRYILVKRPNEGLLAGLWEFPSVPVDEEADLVTRQEVINQHLKNTFNLDLKSGCTIVSREVVGEYIHVFSHIRLKMYIELLVLCLKGGTKILERKKDKATTEWKYVDSKTLASMGLTSGVRKVYTMVQKLKQSKITPLPAKARKRSLPIKKEDVEEEIPLVSPAKARKISLPIKKEDVEEELPLVNPAKARKRSLPIKKEDAEEKLPLVCPAKARKRSLPIKKEDAEEKLPLVCPAKARKRSLPIKKEDIKEDLPLVSRARRGALSS